jgi:hypothetical protein
MYHLRMSSMFNKQFNQSITPIPAGGGGLEGGGTEGLA